MYGGFANRIIFKILVAIETVLLMAKTQDFVTRQALDSFRSHKLKLLVHVQSSQDMHGIQNPNEKQKAKSQITRVI